MKFFIVGCSNKIRQRRQGISFHRDPTQNLYNFDVAYQMPDIITEEERKSPVKPKSFKELMKDVKVYCDLRSEDGENVTSYIKDVFKIIWSSC